MIFFSYFFFSSEENEFNQKQTQQHNFYVDEEKMKEAITRQIEGLVTKMVFLIQ